MREKSFLLPAFVIFFFNSHCSPAANCLITNGVKVGSCETVLEFLDVKSKITNSGIINGAIIRSGGNLELHGISNGNITIMQGGFISIYGKVNGEVINKGGNVTITGHVNKLTNLFGKVLVDGIVDYSTGTIEFKKGSIVNGKEI